MKLESGEELLTIKDLADWIAFDRSEEGISRAMRQIRHWTQNDLLQTVSEKNTGKGIPRFYKETPTFQIAAVLAELARYNASLDILKPAAEALYEDADSYEGYGEYLPTTLTHINVFMQVSWTGDPQTGRMARAKITLIDEIEKEAGLIDFDSQPSSSVLINMTQVMDRVYRNKYGGSYPWEPK